MTAQPLTTTSAEFESLVRQYVTLNAQAETLATAMASIKARIREAYDLGTYHAAGLVVTISEPPRRFNLNRAIDLLPQEALDQCKLEGYDPKLIKRFMAPAVLDLAMDPGLGDRVVRIA